MPSLRILRTGAGSAVAPFVIQALRDAGDVYVVAADIDPLAVGFHFADASVTIPRGDDPALVPYLLRVCAEHEIDVLFPDIDEELLPVAQARQEFEGAGVRVLLSDAAAIGVASDKVAFTQRLQELAVPAPRMFSLRALDSVNFPAFVKPRRGRGSQHAHRVDSREQLEYIVPRVPDPIVQEFIAGVEHTIDGLVSLDGEFLYASVRERLATDSGISVKGRTTVAPQIESHVKTIAEGIGLVGPVCIQCIVDVDGVAHFTDCNPRLGGGTVLSVAAGAPIIGDIVRILNGEPIQGKRDYRSGLTMLRRWDEVYIDPLDGVSAVVFDLDYTLYDADRFNIAALRDVADLVADQHGIDADALAQSLLQTRRELGADHPKLFDEWLHVHEAWSADTVRACVDCFHSHQPENGYEMYPGVRETLVDLSSSGLKLGIVTDGHTQMQKTKLRALQLDDMIDVVVLNAALDSPKPDPAGLQEALRQLGVEPADTVYVGDHPVYDIVMAKAAGARAVRVLTGAFAQRPHSSDAAPDVVLESIAALRGRVTPQSS